MKKHKSNKDNSLNEFLIETDHLMPYATFDMLKDQLLNLKPWHQK